MFNVHYRRETGRIISYQETDEPTPLEQLPELCDQLSLEKPVDINGLKVDTKKKILITKHITLIGEDRAEAMAKMAEGTPTGCFVEIGVYKGGSAFYLQQVATKQGRKLHLFDTFTGIPYQEEIDDTPVGCFSDTSLNEVKTYLPKAIFHVGVFPETLTDDVEDIAFVHFDGDQYRCTKAIKTHIWPRMVSGGIIVFDDSCFHGGLRGVNKALEEDFEGKLREETDVKMLYVVKP